MPRIKKNTFLVKINFKILNYKIFFGINYILSPSVVKSKLSNIEESGFFSAC
jgi:hypothetical protein